MRQFILAFFIFFSFWSCATVKYNTRASDPEFKVRDVVEKPTSVVNGTIVNLNDYKISFEKEYGSNEALLTSIRDLLVSELATKNPNIKVGASEGSEALSGLTSLNQEDIEKARNYFTNETSDLILFVKEVIIDGTTTSQSHAPAIKGGIATTTTTEKCEVQIILEVWDKHKQKEVYEFSTMDEAGVMLFMYGTALTDAVEKTTINAAKYFLKK